MSGCFFSANKGLKSPFFIGKKGENMTEINLMTNDQRLIALQKVVIASGDVNSVRVNVAFDDTWNRFIARTAIFHTAEDPTPHEVLLTNDSCIVPWEVLQKPGQLFIGISGLDELNVDIFESSIKTSTLVKYKISQGAEIGQLTLSPTMDLYQQYLKALDDKIDPFRADVYAQMNAKIAEMEKKMRQHEEALADITEGHLLWENPAPSAEFAAQKIALDLKNYAKVKIIIKATTSGGECVESEMCFKNTQYTIPCYAGTREVTWMDDGIMFGKGTDGLNINNMRGIPLKITGFKSGGIKEPGLEGGDL